MVELIAEIGWNHCGVMDLAEAMIKSAKKAGANYAKFQTWSVKGLKEGPWDNDGRREIYEKAELNEDKHKFLSDCCKENDIKFLTSCFSTRNIDLIAKFCNEVKIPSCECKNQELVNECLNIFDRVFISTGASTQSEYMQWKDHPQVVIMHCVSSYPCPIDQINLPRLDFLMAYYKNVGYSGHYKGIWDAIAAISHGAKVVEKHFTISRNMPGKDNAFSLEPDEFKNIREYADMYEYMTTYKGLDYQESERYEREIHSGRWNNY